MVKFGLLYTIEDEESFSVACNPTEVTLMAKNVFHASNAVIFRWEAFEDYNNLTKNKTLLISLIS